MTAEADARADNPLDLRWAAVGGAKRRRITQPSLASAVPLSPTRSRGAQQLSAVPLPPTRSRGEVDAVELEDLPPLRPGAPARRGYARGSMPSLNSTADRGVALDALLTDVYAASSTRAVTGRRGCYTRLLGFWNQQPLPITVQKVLYLGAGLKAGGYRSAGSVLSQYNVDSIRAGCSVDRAIERALADATRSCSRGLGPPRRALALDVLRFAGLPATPAPWVPGGPVGPRNLMIVGSWWLLREMEAAGARAKHVRILQGDPLVATFLLPTSKTDLRALGAARAQPCICGAAAPRPDCPVHAVWDQLLVLRRLFPGRHSGHQPHTDLPLFPDAGGKAISKIHFTKTLLEGARRSGQQLSNSDGSLRVSGHSLRASGAQLLARMGFDLLNIQLLGRWGSAAVLSYVRDAAVGAEAARTRSGRMRTSVKELASAAASAGVPPADAADFEVLAKRWFQEWFSTAAAEMRPSLIDEALERLRQTTRRASSSGAASASTSSSGSSSSASGAAGGPSDDQPPDGSIQSDVVSSVPDSRFSVHAFRVVGNRKRRKNHVVTIGPPSDPARWNTHCGWKFGRSKDAVAADPAYRRCDRCAAAGGPNWGSSSI